MEEQPRTIQQLREHILTLEDENKALKARLLFARGVPVEELVAEMTEGKRTNYKDGHDITTKNGTRLEVKYSHLNNPNSSKTKRWNWDRILGLNETKKFDFLVLAGLMDPRFSAQYPDLPYVFFVVPRNVVNDIKSSNCIGLNTNLARARATKAKMLKSYLVRSRDEFERFRQVSTD